MPDKLHYLNNGPNASENGRLATSKEMVPLSMTTFDMFNTGVSVLCERRGGGSALVFPKLAIVEFH